MVFPVAQKNLRRYNITFAVAVAFSTDIIANITPNYDI
jgi:hypothetical protein